MVKQLFTYRCDIPKCATPDVVVEHDIYFHLPALRPCAPSGWLYLDHHGLLCGKHNGWFETLTQKFFTESGHE